MAGDFVTLSLPYPPSTNALYNPVRGRFILSAAGRAYHREVALAVLLAGRPQAPAGRLRVALDVFPPDRRRRDIANVEKVVTDSLVGAGVMVDDCLIDRWEITRRAVVRGGRLVVCVGAWEGVEV